MRKIILDVQAILFGVQDLEKVHGQGHECVVKVLKVALENAGKVLEVPFERGGFLIEKDKMVIPVEWAIEVNTHDSVAFEKYRLISHCNDVPEFDKRAKGVAGSKEDKEIKESYIYADARIPVADAKWKGCALFGGWALREAFLAGITYAEIPKAKVIVRKRKPSTPREPKE